METPKYQAEMDKMVRSMLDTGWALKFHLIQPIDGADSRTLGFSAIDDHQRYWAFHMPVLLTVVDDPVAFEKATMRMLTIARRILRQMVQESHEINA